MSAMMSAVPFRARPFEYIAEDSSYDPYPWVRSALRPELAELDSEDIEAALAAQGLDVAAMEGLFDGIGNAFKSAAPAIAQVAGKALPGVISGAATGCALGPWGCLGGAIIGGVGSALASNGKPGGGGKPAGGASGTISAIAGAIPAIAGAVGGGGSTTSAIAGALPAIAGLVGGGSSGGGATAGGGSNPAAVLLGLLQRPEVMQSLMSLALGPSGKKEIPVGGTSVPPSAVANLVGTLGSKAFTKAEADTEPSRDLPAYLYRNGTLAADPGDPAARAGVLLTRIGEVALSSEARIPVRTGFTEADEYYDELDMAELAELDSEGVDLEFDD
jgi:hypothetical protein